VIALHCKQNSEEWHSARLGIPTASRFSDIVTSRGEPCKAASRQRYIHELAGERVARTIQMSYETYAMERGTNLEPLARGWYEMVTGNKVEEVGFCWADESKRWGASPDGLTVTGGIEIKCPLRTGMVEKLLGGKVPTEYLVQIQGEMWVCEREKWDFVLYTDDHGIPSVVWPVERDAKIIAALEEHVPIFSAEVEAATEKLRGIVAEWS